MVAAGTAQWEDPGNAGCRVQWLDGTVTGSVGGSRERGMPCSVAGRHGDWLRREDEGMEINRSWYTTVDSNGSLVR